MGTVRVRYTNKESVFTYRGMRRQDALEKVGEHLAAFPADAAPTGDPAKLDGRGFREVKVDLSTVIAEWVEDEGTPQETVELLQLPNP